MEAVTYFLFLAPKSQWMVTEAMKLRCLLLGRKAMTKPRHHIEKHRHHFANKDLYSQSLWFFSVVTYRCESWTIKTAELQRIDAFKLWCWRRLLRVPWTAKRSNQSILKEINAEYSLEGLLLNLHYFGHLMPRVDSLVKTDAGKDWRQKEEGEAGGEFVR